MVNLRIAALVLSLGLLAGCQTTGDPTKGGLYGWDEEKAKQRQQHLKQSQQSRQALLAALEEKNQQLATETMAAAHQLALLRQERDMLHEQNQLLSKCLATVDDKKQRKQEELRVYEALHDLRATKIDQMQQNEINWQQEEINKLKVQKQMLLQEVHLLLGK